MKFGKTDTNFCFEPGKLTVLLDVTYGSSAKGKLASFITEHATNWDFCCNAFMPNAGHWVKLDDGREFFYQTFNSCAYNHEKFEKMYIGPGAVIELPAFWKELEKNIIRHQRPYRYQRLRLLTPGWKFDCAKFLKNRLEPLWPKAKCLIAS